VLQLWHCALIGVNLRFTERDEEVPTGRPVALTVPVSWMAHVFSLTGRAFLFIISTVCGVSSAASFLPAARLRFGHAEVFEPNPDSADPVQDRSTNVLPFKRLVGRASRNFRFLLTGRLPELEF
jgi:hypothetical protein